MSRYDHDSNKSCRSWYDDNYTDIFGYPNMKDFEKEYWIKYGLSEYFNSTDSVLDVGCGNGRFSNFFKTRASKVVAIDPIMKINETFGAPNLHYHRSDFLKFQGDFDKNTGSKYDVILMLNVMCMFTMKNLGAPRSIKNHNPEGIQQAFIKINKLIVPGGHVVIAGDKARLLGEKNRYTQVTHRAAFPRAGDVGEFPVDYPWEPEPTEEACGNYNLPFLCDKYGFKMTMFGPSKNPRRFCAVITQTGDGQ